MWHKGWSFTAHQCSLHGSLARSDFQSSCSPDSPGLSAGSSCTGEAAKSAARGLAFNGRAPLSTTRSWRGRGEVSEFQESRNMLDSLLSLGCHVAQVGLNTEPRVSPRFLILLASTPGQGGSGDLTTKPHLSLRFLSDILIYKHLLQNVRMNII